MTSTVTTAAALVTAGRELFGRHGFQGASVRAITRLAGANLGAVTYHFGSKGALYGAVVSSAVDPLAVGLMEVAAQPGPAIDRLEWCMRLCLDYMDENPEVAALLARPVEGDRFLPESAEQPIGRIVSTLTDLIAEGQAAGAIRTGDPSLLAASVMAQPIHFALARSARAVAAGDRAGAATDWDRIAEHTIAFVRAGLGAASPDAPEPTSGRSERGRTARRRRRRR